MDRIVIEITSGAGVRREVHAFDKSDILIGRGYASDLIIQDPFVSGRHVQVGLLPEGSFCVRDVGSENGTFLLNSFGRGTLSKKEVRTDTVVPSGQTIQLGATILRIYHAEHPVDPAKVFSKKAREKTFFTRPRMLGAGLVLYFGVYFLEMVLNSDQLQVSPAKVLFLQVLTLLGISLWPGVWALVGRLIRQKSRFQTQLTLTLFYAVGLLIINNVSAYWGFFFMNRTAEEFSKILLGGVAFMLLLFGNLTYATRLSQRVRGVTAVMIPLVILGLGLVGAMLSRGMFSPEPDYYGRIKPPFVPVIRIYKIEEATARTVNVFRRAGAMEAARTDFVSR